MCDVGGEPDGLAYINAIKACSTLGALDQGKQLHAEVNRFKNDTRVVINHSLMDMYIKCGSIEQTVQCV